MDPIVKKPYRHGNVPNALRAAALAILDESGGSHEVVIREAARRIGVTPTAVYRHFASRDDFLASVAAEGFRELAASMEAAATGPDPSRGCGLAYIEFALRKRDLFRLMFGPLLADRAKYPRLREAAKAAFRAFRVALAGGDAKGDELDSIAAWGLIHGLSSLFIEGLVPEERIQSVAEKVLATAISSRTARAPTAIAA